MCGMCWTTWHQAINDMREAEKIFTSALIAAGPMPPARPLPHSSLLCSLGHFTVISTPPPPFSFTSRSPSLVLLVLHGHPDGVTGSLSGLGRGGVGLHISIFPPVCFQSLNMTIFVYTVGLCMSNLKLAADKTSLFAY